MSGSSGDIAALDRIATRVALTKEEELEALMGKLICPVILKLGTDDNAVKAKVTQLISVINQRVKAAPDLKLPTKNLLQVFREHNESPLIANVALMQLVIAIQRVPTAELRELIGHLSSGISQTSGKHKRDLLHLTFFAITAFEGGLHEMSTQEKLRQGLPFLASGADRQELLEFALKLMLHPPVRQQDPSNPLQAGALAQRGLGPLTAPAQVGGSIAALPRPTGVLHGAGGAQIGGVSALGPLPGEADAPGAVDADEDMGVDGPGIEPADSEGMAVGPVAPGLSSEDMETITKSPPGLSIDAAGMDKRRLGFLKLVNAAEDFEPQEVALVALAGSCCPDEQVSRAADVVLQKRCTLDGIKPSIDLEDEALLGRFFELIAGSGADKAAPQKRPPASAALRMRLLRICCKSVKAANLMPRTLEVIVAGLERSRIASINLAACEFVVWVLKHADDDAMAAMAKPAFDRVIGSLSMMDPSDSGPAMQLRGFLYQAVGELAQRAPEVFHNDVEIAGSFFQALAAEPDGIRATVQEAINRLAAAYKNLPEGSQVARALRAMLEAQSRSQVEGVRACSLNWAVEVFPFDDAFARMMCMRLASDPRPGIRAAAQKGLKIADDTAVARDRGTAATAGSTPTHPSFSQMLTAVRSQYKALRATPVRSTLSAPVETLTAVLKFLEACHRRGPASTAAGAAGAEVDAEMADSAELDGGKRPRAEDGAGNGDDDGGARDDDGGVMDVDGEGAPATPEFSGARNADGGAVGAGGTDGEGSRGGALAYGGQEHLVLLEHALVREAPTELQLIALTQLLAVAHIDPAVPAAHMSARLPWLRAFLSHVNAEVRLATARLLGSITAALPPASTKQLLSDLVQRLPGESGNAAEGTSQTAAVDASKSNLTVKFAETHGSLLATGLVASGAHMGATGAVSKEELAKATKAVAAELCNGDVQAALAAVRALGFMALSGTDMLPIGELKVPDLTAPAKSAAGGAAPATMADILTKLVLLLKDPRLGSDAKARAPVVRALGHLAAGTSSAPLRAAYVDILLAQTPPSAAEEFHFAVGESLCLAHSGACASIAKALLFSPSPTLAELRRTRELLGGLPGTADAGAAAAPVACGSDELKDKVLDGASKKASSGTSDERAASSVWLVLLLVLCGEEENIAKGLPRLQAALVALLAGDTSDLVQDMASHGLSAAYSAGSAATKEQLVKALVEKLQMAGPTLLAAKEDAAQEDAAKGAAKPVAASAGQGSLATYRELCALSTSLGKPQLLYALIDVAAEATPSAARRGAALGLHAESTDASRALLQPHVAALLPLLYRASYDPNTRVSDAMTHLLTTIVPQRAAALTEHFAAVMKELLASLGGRSWRSRQAACLATADILPGRRWPLLQPHFGALWDAALRVADDAKDSVRVNGERLLRSLSNITCRLADIQQTTAADSSEALARALPLLIDKGLQCRSASVRNAAVGTLASIVAVAAPHEISLQLAPLIAALLEALSTLEANQFNVLDMHADRLGVDRNTLEETRLQVASKTPIHGALDTCARLVDEKSVHDVAAALARLVRQGVGLNTRTGAARVVVALTMRLPAPTLQKPAGELLKALLPAVAAERSAATQRAFAGAIGALSKSASGKRLEWLVTEASTMFSNADDDEARKAGGLVLQQICRSAAQRLDATATAGLLPRALRARYDPDATVAAAAADIMTELGASAATVLRASGAAAAAPVIADLAAAATRSRRMAAAAAAAGFAADGGAALAPATAASLAAALIGALPGRAWAGKEAVTSALAAVATAVPSAFTTSPLPRLDPPVPDATAPDDGAVVDALVATAVKPGGREVSEAAAAALVKALEAFKGRDHLARLSPVLKVLEGQLQHDKPPGGAGGMEEDTPAPLPMLSCLAATAAALQHLGTAAAGAPAAAFTTRLAPLCAACLAAIRPWKLRLQAAQTCEVMLGVLAAADGAGDAAARRAVLGGGGDVPGPLLACAGLKTEKVAQVRAACVACAQAAAPLLSVEGDAEVVSAIKAALSEITVADKDPTTKAAAGKLLKERPFADDGAEPMEH